MRSKTIRCGILLLLMGVLVNCKRQGSPEHLFRVSLWANEKHTWYQAFNYFAEILAERSNGEMKVEVYPSEQLANEITLGTKPSTISRRYWQKGPTER